MLGSPNLRRGNVPLATRLKIEDLHAHLAPLNRYGLSGLGSAMTDGVRALARRGFKGAPRALCCSVGRPPRNRSERWCYRHLIAYHSEVSD